LPYQSHSIEIIPNYSLVQEINLQNSLIQAQKAASQEDWSLLLQWLQQQVLSENWLSTIALSSALQKNHELELLVQSMLKYALDILQHGDFQQRWDVAKLFPHFGDRAIPALLALVNNTDLDPDIRWFAVRVVGEFRQPEVLAALVNLLCPSEDDEIQEAAITALAGFGVEAIASLSVLLETSNTRLLAIRTLAQIYHIDTVPLLLQVAHDDQPLVREMAIAALSSIPDPRTLDVLIGGLSDSAAAVRRAAVTGLGLRSEQLNELDGVAYIKPLLLDLSLDVCQQAAIALSRFGTDAAATALFEVLRSPLTPVSLQIDLVRSLAWMETPKALTYLQQVLQHEPKPLEQVSVIQEIITVLGRIDSPLVQQQAANVLLDLLHTKHVALQQSALRQTLALSLGQLGQSVALEPLIHLLADDDEGVRLHAVAALKQLDAPMARQRLETLLSDNSLRPDLARGVMIALQEW
jgi:HEAT repeat protein